jgi:diguanylate cyclase (GGDEF)-like protein
MHPEDRAWVVDFCVSQSQSGTDHEADYRALTREGEYVWIRDVVHVLRDDNGEVDALIGFMFDISERKQTEQQLLELQTELEELSFKDGLTGVPNRRKFDSVLEEEWIRARREKHPISLLLIDIDFFKQYNDFYGHIVGDDCLKQVAQALSSAATRSRDFVARYGGEEFVMVLPEADSNAAMSVAERCKNHISRLAIPHLQSEVDEWLTISIGAGTLIPTHSDDLREFIDEVDQALYKAKQQGRNQIQHSAGE